MKILKLLEAKFIQPVYSYHATTSNNLKSIISNGLVPNYSGNKNVKGSSQKGGYGSGEFSAFGYPLTSLSGIYLTDNPKTAKSISTAIGDDSSYGIIVICKVQPRQTELDEDRLSADIIQERKLLHTIIDKVRKFPNGKKDFTDDERVKFSEQYTKHILKTSLDIGLSDKTISNVTPSIHNYIKALVDFWYDEDGTQNSQNVKHAQHELTVKLKSAKEKDPTNHYTFKLNAPIGFSGANKIVGIYNPRSGIGWGDLGYFSADAYHTVRTPTELLNRKD